jgi:hypothetical protein
VIVGLDIVTVSLCRCGCPLLRVAPYSKRSTKLILRCVWCRSRRGAPSEAEIQKLEAFTKKFGWVARPLALADNGEILVR